MTKTVDYEKARQQRFWAQSKKIINIAISQPDLMPCECTEQ